MQEFTYIDLFCGVGGFRIALDSLGGTCVFSSEINKHSQKTYFDNFGEYPHGDITAEKTKSAIPKNFDILCGGFPCQAFSRMGKQLGFEDTRGTLFFDVAEIIKKHEPKVFILENVEGLFLHDGGKTFSTIINVLRDDLNYFVPDPEFLDAANFGLAARRKRIFIIGFRKDLDINFFEYPKGADSAKVFADIAENDVADSFWVSERLHRYIFKRAQDLSFGKYPINKNQKSCTLTTGVTNGGVFAVYDNCEKSKTFSNVRLFTPREFARLQGFPDSFIMNPSKIQAYKQFGNSVAIPVVAALAKKVIQFLFERNKEKCITYFSRLKLF